MVKQRSDPKKPSDSSKPRRKTTVVLDRVSLNQRMERKNLTVDALAELVMRASRSGADKQRRVRDILAGENPRPKTVNEFARVLGVASSELIDQDATLALHREIDEHNQRLQQGLTASPNPNPSPADDSSGSAAAVGLNRQQTDSPSRFGRWQLVTVGCLLCLLIASIVWKFVGSNEPENAAEIVTLPQVADPIEPQPSPGRPSIASLSSVPPSLALYIPQGPSAQGFAEALSTALAAYWPSLEQLNWLAEDAPLPSHHDYGLAIRTSLDQGYMAIWVSISEGPGGDRRLIWADVLPADFSPALVKNIANFAAKVVHSRLTTAVEFTTLKPRDIENFIHGSQQFQQGRDELLVRRAQAIFQRLVDKHPSWVNARAALCRAHVEEHRLLRTPASLDAAEPHCKESLRLRPDSVEALRANAMLERRRQNPQAAETLFRKSLEIDDQNMTTLVGLSKVLAMKYVTQDSAQALTEAISFADQSIAVAPDNWQSHFERARLAYLKQDLTGAIRISERAIELQRNEFTYANLNVFLVCRGAPGDLQRAIVLLAEYRALKPESTTISVNLGTAHYYAGDFERAAAEFKWALEKEREAGGISHHILGNYADALRHLGNTDEAVLAYEQALDLANSATIRGENVLTHRSAASYYQSALVHLQTPALEEAALKQRKAALVTKLTQFERRNLSPPEQIRIAKAWLLLGEEQRVRELKFLDDLGCPGYLAEMDLRSFSAQN